MKKPTALARLETGVRNLDPILQGGIPRSSVVVISGPPGSGKTILAQQLCFHNATAENRVLYLSTLSEPTAKTLRHLEPFGFFDPGKLGTAVQFIDLGSILRSNGLPEAAALIMQHVKKVKPAIVVVDSFKVFDDLASSREELRKVGYELAVNLMAWEVTALLLGEYAPDDYETSPLFSIVDGLVVLSQREALGEHQRFLKVVKLRGTDHSRDDHAFQITAQGIEVFAPKVTIQREPAADTGLPRLKFGIDKLDELLGPGIPRGSSLLVGGVAGTGKTVLALEFLYRGALAGEKGILFSFEETAERLRATARGLGWKLDEQIERGLVQIVFIPQPSIQVEAHLLMIREQIDELKAKRVVIDSVSVFLHKVPDPQVAREKVFHLCTIVQNAQAVGLFSTDIPYGSEKISRFGVEETVVDGVILLSSTTEGLERQRYVEIYKLRNTAHLKGRHNLVIGHGGLSVYPRYQLDSPSEGPPPALEPGERLGTGVEGLDPLLGGGLLRRSVTLVSGSPGIGKTTLGLQFLLEGAKVQEKGLYVTLEEGPAQLVASARALGLPLEAALDAKQVEFLYVAREHLRAGQLLTVLADRAAALGARRLVLDAVTQMMAERTSIDELLDVLHKLTVRFKTLGVTSVLTLESPALFSTETVTGRSLSPIADNLVMLRYREVGLTRVPMLTVVKSRGSEHDTGTYPLVLDEHGIRVGSAGDGPAPRTRTPARGTPPGSRT